MSDAAPAWVFDPVPPSGALSGGDPTSYLFSPDLDSLVREVVQNSTDQQAGDNPVSVTFTLHELTEDARETFLGAIDWANLREHLDGVAASPSLINGRVRDALAEIDGGRLLLLQIEDTGTRGLTGPEDGTEGNFAALCKHKLVTNDQKAVRGGSYGLGKAVLWRFSALSTVLFGSRYTEDDRPHRRVYGRTELPFHDADHAQWSGPGWFGLPEDTNSGWRALSLRGETASRVSHDLFVDRDETAGTGTTALIVAFAEPGQETARPVGEITEDIARAASRWFWPRISDGSLEVRARGVVGGSVTSDVLGSLELADPGYVGAASGAATGETAEAPGELAEREIELRIPRLRSETASGDVEGHVTVRLLRTDDADGPATSRLALMRGAGMIVKHYKVPGIPLPSGGYRAVLLAGLRHGDADSDRAIEEFLRAAEPPEHNDWVHHTNALKSRYRPGAKSRLDELWNKIRLAVLEICSSKPGGEEPGPALLAKYFQIGGSKGTVSARHKFEVRFDETSFDGRVWTVRGRVTRSRGERGWTADIDVKLEGESGLKSSMILSQATTSAFATHSLIKDQQLMRVHVPKGRSALEFAVSASPSDEDRELITESRMRVDVRPYESEV